MKYQTAALGLTKESISDFEMRMLPEFFTGRSPTNTPAFYLESRNFIVKAYEDAVAEEGPAAYVTATFCRSKIPGDVCSVLRIHEFLETWGVINRNAEDSSIEAARKTAFPVPLPPSELWESEEKEEEEGEEENVAASKQKAAAEGGGLAQGVWSDADVAKLMRLAREFDGNWSAVAVKMGSGVSPVSCLEKFMSLSFDQIFSADTGSVSNDVLGYQNQSGEAMEVEENRSYRQTQSEAPSSSLQKELAEQLSRLSEPLETANAPAILLARSLVKNCHPEVLAATLSTAVQEMKKHTRGVEEREGEREELLPRREGETEASTNSGSKGEEKGKAKQKQEGDGQGVSIKSEGERERDRDREREGSDVKDEPPPEGEPQAARKEEREQAEGESKSRALVKASKRKALERDAVAMGAGSATALSVVAMQARALAEDERNEVQQLLNDLVEIRLQQLEAKTQQLDDLESLLLEEKETMAYERAELFLHQARSRFPSTANP